MLSNLSTQIQSEDTNHCRFFLASRLLVQRYEILVESRPIPSGQNSSGFNFCSLQGPKCDKRLPWDSIRPPRLIPSRKTPATIASTLAYPSERMRPMARSPIARRAAGRASSRSHLIMRDFNMPSINKRNGVEIHQFRDKFEKYHPPQGYLRSSERLPNNRVGIGRSLPTCLTPSR